jgi:hypothetical protein
MKMNLEEVYILEYNEKQGFHLHTAKKRNEYSRKENKMLEVIHISSNKVKKSYIELSKEGF